MEFQQNVAAKEKKVAHVQNIECVRWDAYMLLNMDQVKNNPN